MSEQQGEYVPGTYVRGDKVRIARTPAEAVSALFDGYTLQAAPEPELEKEEAPADSTDQEPVKTTRKTRTA